MRERHAAGDRDHPAPGQHRQRREELGGLLRPGDDAASWQAHPQHPPGFGDGDLHPQDPGEVLALERDQVPSGIENGHRQRRQP